MKRKSYDAIVVGSGASGGWVAKVLAEGGMEVLMLEAGPPRMPERDFTEHMWPYQFRFRGFGDQRKQLLEQPLQRLHAAVDEATRHFFIKDAEHPYTYPKDKPAMWTRARQVGGKSLLWARCSYRYSDLEFQAARRDGYGEDWPISYRDIAPYYDRVESYVGVSGSAEGVDSSPDGRFLPPFRLSCGEVYARDLIAKSFGWKLIRDRRAVLTVPHNGRPACHYCDECRRGCFTASYFSSPTTTLPDAVATGRFTLVSDAVVSHLKMDDRGKANGVVFLDRTTKAEREANARIVVLAASALESTRILLNSRSPRFPEGVGASSGVLGHYLMDHFIAAGGTGTIPVLHSSKREPSGRPAGVVIPKYVNADPRFPDKRFLRGYYMGGGAHQDLYGQAFHTKGFGQQFRKKVRENISYNFAVFAQAECLPYYDNYVKLDPHKKDAWGIPALHIHGSYKENEYAMAGAMKEKVGELLDALKLDDKQVNDKVGLFGQIIHECGTARMGNNPKTSVLNRYNQVHDAKNVFVTDAACFTTSSCYEPTLTIMALSARAADYMLEESKRGNL